MVTQDARTRLMPLSLLLCGSLLLWGCQWIDPTQIQCSESSADRCTAFPGYSCDVQAGRCEASSSSGDDGTVPGVLNGGGSSTGDDDDASSTGDDDDASGSGGTGSGTGTSPCEDDVYENNDSFLFASALGEVSSITMQSLKACDADWYSFSPDDESAFRWDGGYVTIGLSFDHDQADLELRLFRDQETELESSLTQDNVEVIGPVALDVDSTYYIQVHELSENYVGSTYEMTIQYTDPGRAR